MTSDGVAREARPRSTPAKDPGDLQVGLLGGFDVTVGETRVPEGSWRLRRARDVVKLLALASGHHLHREQVMELLWPERTPEAAANNLHQALHVGRRALEHAGGRGAMLQLRDGVVHLCPDDDLRVDVESYEIAAHRARGTGSLEDFVAARDLYGGELLPDDRYEEWATDRREALAQDHLSLLWDLAGLQAAAGDRSGAAETLRQLVSIDPVHEAAHRELMRIYAFDGHHRLAMRQFELVRSALDRDLDVEPDEETENLRRDILAGRVGAHAERPIGPSVEPPRADVHELVGATPAVSRPPHNLPVQLSSFIGREREREDIGRLLTSTRVLTLTGVGGCGKTRLAIEAASALRSEFPDGVWYVPLAALGRPSLVIQAVAEVFEVREDQGQPPLETLAAHIGAGRVLLVLDNCEHLVDACAEVIEALLVACPNLRVLTTSRQPIRIAGEVVFRVSSLDLPDPDAPIDLDAMAGVASVALFAERASAIAPGFALSLDNAADVARLCFHLDGLPLAIELAASRAAALPIAAIVDRLDGRFQLLVGGSRTAISRQQTLKATLDWSYHLLSDAERAVLRRLAVFVGGIPLDAAEDVSAGADVEPTEVLGILTELVDKSLVVPEGGGTEPRFRLLETVREYGLEQLDDEGERAEVEARHARWYLGLAVRMRDALPRPERGAFLDRMEREHDNVRAAFDRSLADDPTLAVRLSACMGNFWLWRAYLTEGRRRIGLALDRSDAPSTDRAEAMLALSYLGVRSGDVAHGLAEAFACAALAEELGEATIVCRALQVAGCALWSQDQLDEARAAFERGLAAAADAGFEPGVATSTHNLGLVELVGDPARASSLLEGSLEAFRALADTPQVAPALMDVGEFVVPQPATDGFRLVWEETFSPFQDVPCATAFGFALANQAMFARTEGDLDRARGLMEESLALFEALGDDRAIGQALGRLGNLAIAEKDLSRARELLEAGFELRRRIGDWRGMMMAQRSLGNLAVAEGAFDAASRLFEEAAATFRRRGDLWGYGGAVADLASLAIARGDPLDESRRRLDESIETIRRVGRTRWLAWAMVQSAELRRAAGDVEAARTELAETLGSFERLGDRLGIARCRKLLAAP